MKMPKRRHFPNFRLDVFGLPPPTILTLEEEAPARQRMIKAKVESMYVATVRHLGEEEARKLFVAVTRKKKRGRTNDEQVLLDAYDKRKPCQSVRSLAQELFTEYEGRPVPRKGRKKARKTPLGSSARAIETSIHKLVKNREKEQRVAARDARALRMALRKEPPTILSQKNE